MAGLQERQHTRYNPLTDEWVLVSPHRLKRPWQGKIEKPQERNVPSHDPNNPLCPGVTRPNGKVNPNYRGIYSFDNDFPALQEDSIDTTAADEHPLLKTGNASGTCRVICFHDRLDMSLPLMDVEEIVRVIKEWIRQTAELSHIYMWVQIFENKGDIMGCSNPHPHCQVWASCFMPNEARKEDEHQKKYFEKNGTSLLLDYANLESIQKVRTVAENERWIVVVPFWAVWPYELLLLPKKSRSRMTNLDDEDTQSLALIMKVFLTKYDNLFETSFPYSMGWHGAPNSPCDVNSPSAPKRLKEEDSKCSHWQLHAHYYPPLLRSATVKKHMVGYEMLAQAQRDITAEQAAKQLCDLSDIHYKVQKDEQLKITN